MRRSGKGTYGLSAWSTEQKGADRAAHKQTWVRSDAAENRSHAICFNRERQHGTDPQQLVVIVGIFREAIRVANGQQDEEKFDEVHVSHRCGAAIALPEGAAPKPRREESLSEATCEVSDSVVTTEHLCETETKTDWNPSWDL